MTRASVLRFRQATAADLDAMARIAAEAKAFFAPSGRRSMAARPLSGPGLLRRRHPGRLEPCAHLRRCRGRRLRPQSRPGPHLSPPA